MECGCRAPQCLGPLCRGTSLATCTHGKAARLALLGRACEVIDQRHSSVYYGRSVGRKVGNDFHKHPRRSVARQFLHTKSQHEKSTQKSLGALNAHRIQKPGTKHEQANDQRSRINHAYHPFKCGAARRSACRARALPPPLRRRPRRCRRPTQHRGGALSRPIFPSPHLLLPSPCRCRRLPAAAGRARCPRR
jgi:hypothetical protein